MTKDQINHENKNEPVKKGGKFTWTKVGVIVAIIVLIGGYFLMKANPPLQITATAYNEDNTSVVLGVGNTGFSGILLKEVKVNAGEDLPEVKLQVADASKGLIVVDDFKYDEEGYSFINLDSRYIKTGTTFKEIMTEEGEMVEVPEVFGISIIHDEPIETIHIKYSHFGVSYEETVELTH